MQRGWSDFGFMSPFLTSYDLLLVFTAKILGYFIKYCIPKYSMYWIHGMKQPMILLGRIILEILKFKRRKNCLSILAAIIKVVRGLEINLKKFLISAVDSGGW